MLSMLQISPIVAPPSVYVAVAVADAALVWSLTARHHLISSLRTESDIMKSEQASE